MRVVKDPQMKLGAIPIGDIKFDTKSRDDIPRILLALQYIYVTPEVRQEVFKILEELIPDSVIYDDRKANPNKGRKGMEQWTILVLGTLRLGLNDDYDRIHDLSNNHNKVRQMLGHSEWCDDTYYELQTIRDNVCLFTPDMLDRISQIVVRAGHVLVKKKRRRRACWAL